MYRSGERYGYSQYLLVKYYYAKGVQQVHRDIMCKERPWTGNLHKVSGDACRSLSSNLLVCVQSRAELICEQHCWAGPAWTAVPLSTVFDSMCDAENGGHSQRRQ